MCGRCHREKRDELREPPKLRDEFFETDEFRAAFESHHIGKVFKAYRNHPRHLHIYGKALNQDLLGRWLGLNQAQVSKLENAAEPEQNFRTLSNYARILHLPQHLLWFDLPGQSRLKQPDGSVDSLNPVNRRSFLTASSVAAADAALLRPARVRQALEIVTSDDAETLGMATDCLNELISHYSEKLSVSSSAEMYDDLLNVRSYAGSLLERSKSPTPQKSDLVVATGWLSNLLAVATSHVGDHGSALIWCIDAERRSYESGYRDIAGWAALTRAMIAYYRGRADRSIELASSGQRVAPTGTVAHAKLAAHEMRVRAMLGDADGMEQAKRRATKAIAGLSSDVPTAGVFSISISPSGEPPYTATSLLLLNRFREASSATKSVIEAAYPSGTRNRDRQSSGYARALLILGLAEAGLGHIDEAVSAGREALDSSGLVWPTLVLASKLDRTLMRDYKDVADVADYHTLYLDVADRASSEFQRAGSASLPREDE